MLIKPHFMIGISSDPILIALSEAMGNDDPLPAPFVDSDGKTHEGAYTCPHFNFGNLIVFPGAGDRKDWMREQAYRYPHFGDDYDGLVPPHPYDLLLDADAVSVFDSYGVCDTPEQILNGPIGDKLREDKREFVISFTHVPKGEPPGRGGWRWHKWGPYIGTGKPEYEYLDDEEGFKDGVYTYHIYQLGGEIFVPAWKKRMDENDAKRKAEKEAASERGAKA